MVQVVAMSYNIPACGSKYLFKFLARAWVDL